MADLLITWSMGTGKWFLKTERIGESSKTTYSTEMAKCNIKTRIPTEANGKMGNCTVREC